MSTGAPELVQDVGGGIAPGRETSAEIAARSPLELFWRRVRRDRVTLASALFILGLVVVAVFAGQIVDLVGARPPNEQSTKFLDEFGSASGPDFAAHSYFGTDGLGRDVFSRTLYGARISLEVAIISTFLTVLIGVVLGVIAGYFRGWADTLLSRLMDVMLAFPVLLLALGLGAACSFGQGCVQMSFANVGQVMVVFGVAGAFLVVGWRLLRARGAGDARPRAAELAAGAAAWLVVIVPGLVLWLAVGGHGALITPGLPVVIFVIVIASWPYIARIIRGQTLSLREKEFVEAAKALGASDRRIMFRHILPNLVAPIIVYTTLVIPTTILFEAALSFLGVGVQPPTASWGAMISDATEIFDTAWWYMTFPGLALVLTVLAFNLVGDGMQDALNPKTRGR